MKEVSPTTLSLRGRLSFLAKDSILYGGAGAFNKAFALIAFPILARHFSVSDYGTIDLFTSVTLVLTMLAVFGQDSAVARYFYEYEELEHKKQVISQSLLFQLLGLFVFCPMLFHLTDNIAPFISDSERSASIFRLVLMQLPFMVIINFSQNILKWTFNRSSFLTISIGSTVTSVLVLLSLVLFSKLSIEDVFKAYLFTRAIFGFLGLWFVRTWLVAPKNFNILKDLCRYAFPLGMVCFIGSIMPLIERYIIFNKLGSHELGYYAVAVKISMFIVLPIQAFQMAWGPFSLSLFKEENSIETFNWVLKIFTLGILSAVLIVSALSAPLIYFLASSRYMDSVYIVFPMLFALSIEGIAWITTVGIGFSKRSSFDLFSCLVFVIVSTFSSYFLVKCFGFYGAAWGSLIGGIVRALIGTYFAQKLHFLEWNLKGVFILCATVLLLGTLVQYVYFSVNNNLGIFSFACLLVLIWYPGIYVLFSQSERSVMYSTYKAFLARKYSREASV